jgi:hypothetical protein
LTQQKEKTKKEKEDINCVSCSRKKTNDVFGEMEQRKTKISFSHFKRKLLSPTISSPRQFRFLDFIFITLENLKSFPFFLFHHLLFDTKRCNLHDASDRYDYQVCGKVSSLNVALATSLDKNK